MRKSDLMGVICAALCATIPAPGQAAWSSAVGLANTPSRYEVDAATAIDAGGGVHLVYQDFLNSDGAFYYMNNLSGGWSTRQLLGTAGGKGSVPLLVITPDNQLHALFGKGRIYWTTKPVVGGAWTTPVEVAINCGTAGGNFSDHVVVDSAGGVYYMWGHLFDDTAPVRNGIYGRYKPLGGAWGATEVIAGNSNDGSWPNGDSLFAEGTTLWVAITHDGAVSMKKRVAGAPWSPSGYGTVLQSGGGGRFAQNPANPSEIAFTWGEDAGGGATGPWVEIYAAFSYDHGATWTAPYNVSNKTALDRMQEMAYDASGNLHVVWQAADCDGCTLHLYYRARMDGTWNTRQAITSSSTAAGMVISGFQAAGNTLHLAYSAATNFWDVYYMNNVLSPPPQTPPSIYPVVLSHNPLIADDTIQHTVTLQAGDINGLNDLKSMRWLINNQGTSAGAYRGYIVWGQTPADIARYDGGSIANWSILPVNSGTGYWGINTASYGGTSYLNIRSVAESTFGNLRTVVFTFSVKPAFFTAGPLTNNDISAFADDAVSSTGWQNNDLNFAIAAANYSPGVDSISLGSAMLLADAATQYQVTLRTSDGNGAADIRASRLLINYQGTHAGAYRGYLAWGQTAADIYHWDGYASWTTAAVNSGSGFWGFQSGYGGQTYIQPLAATESTSGSTRTVVFTFKVLPAFYTQGPLNDNDISGFVEDTYTYTGWTNFDLNFRIYPLPLGVPDFDRDTDVDMEDFGHLQKCLTGPYESNLQEDCGNAQLDLDNDIDSDDVDIFMACFSGPGSTPAADCLP